MLVGLCFINNAYMFMFYQNPFFIYLFLIMRASGGALSTHRTKTSSSSTVDFLSASLVMEAEADMLMVKLHGRIKIPLSFHDIFRFTLNMGHWYFLRPSMIAFTCMIAIILSENQNDQNKKKCNREVKVCQGNLSTGTCTGIKWGQK